MRRLSLSLLALTAVVLAACAPPAAPPTSTPEPPIPLPPSPTPSADEPAAATPLPPGVEPPPGAPPPYAPAPGDEKLQRGQAFVDTADIVTAESFPPQFFLALSGSLPTPCHQLRVKVIPPAGQNRIQVEVYSVADPDQVCIQVLEPFNVNVRLGTFSPGKYEVWVNNQPVGEIEAP